MAKRDLSPREEEIVQLCVEGQTNDAIAHKLDISVGTVNTYWLRIRLKVGGSGRTDTVVRIIKERAEKALTDANSERKSLLDMVAEREHHVVELRAALALFHLAMEQIRSTVWAADMDLVINILANGEHSVTHFGADWKVGNTVFEIFKTHDENSPAIKAHLEALAGKSSETRLEGEFANMILRVVPLKDETDVPIGCVSILNSVGAKLASAKEPGE
jgi:DNA-binding CsgD family transcriptional regulator